MFDPRQHTIPIYDYNPIANDSAAASAEIKGSGILVEFHGREFVITAAHVLEELINWIGFGRRMGTKWAIVGAGNMPVVKPKALRYSGDAQRAIYPERVDLAIITPTEPMLEFLHEQYRPYSIEHEFPEFSVEYIVACGWPGAYNEFDFLYDCFKSCSPLVFNCPVADEKVPLVNGDFGIHFASAFDSDIDFRMPDGSLASFPKLPGMSGGGAWAMEEASLDFFPRCAICLAGVVVEYHVQQGILLMIHIKHIASLLKIAAKGTKIYVSDEVRVQDNVLGHFDGRVLNYKMNENGEFLYLLEPCDEFTPQYLFSDWISEKSLEKIGWQKIP